MSSYSIGVIFPSRGLVFAETFKELLNELKPYSHTIYWSHGNSLPSCFNKPLTKALKASHSHIWIVEDDMVLKPGILKELLEADEDIIACDYPIDEAPSGTVLYDCEDNAIFSGTGCMLIKKQVLLDMPKPIFRSDIIWYFKHNNGNVVFSAENADPDKVYGNHDISFGLYQYINNKPIVIAKTILSQRKLKQKGDNNNNIGIDDIVLYDKYRKISHYMLQDEESKLEKSKTVTVKLDGKDVTMMTSMASKLESQGLIEIPKITKFRNIIVDVNDNQKAIKYFGNNLTKQPNSIK